MSHSPAQLASNLPADVASLDPSLDRVDWLRIVPFILIHLGCLLVLVVGVSWPAVLVCAGMYVLRMFVITGFYHRYFSHRTFKTSRLMQALAAFIGCMAGQRGPLWWAAHHRHHHQHADDRDDPHSPRHRGFLWAHTGWFLTPRAFVTRHEWVRDWARFPELMFLNRFDFLPVAVYGVLLFALGAQLELHLPQLGVTAWQLFVWGFFVSTTLLYHATYTINSLAHRFGTRRFDTNDDSRNNFWLALITLGEGWHNNHHHYPAACRQGFYWWEIDVTWYLLLGMQRLGLIWNLRDVNDRVLRRRRIAAN